MLEVCVRDPVPIRDAKSNAEYATLTLEKSAAPALLSKRRLSDRRSSAAIGTMAMNLSCPQCHSENTQKLSAIVASGTEHVHGRARTRSLSTGTTSGMGVAMGPRGLSSVHSYGRVTIQRQADTNHASTTQSGLARRLSAPARKPENLLLFLVLLIPLGLLLSVIPIGIGYALGGATGKWATIAALCAGTCFLFKGMAGISAANREYNRTVWVEKKTQWDRSFFCHRCEHVFAPPVVNVNLGTP